MYSTELARAKKKKTKPEGPLKIPSIASKMAK